MAITNATFTPANATMINAAQGVIPVEQGQLIIQDVMSNSVMMQLAKYEPMNAPKKEIDVFLGGLGAYWVGEGQRIETTSPKWTKVDLEAKKLGVILPVTREYLHYKQADFFNFMRPYLAEALYKKFDAAVFGNIDNPFSQSVDQSATGERAIEGDINMENYDKIVAALNDAGYEPNAFASKVNNSTALRGLVRDENGLKTRVYDANNKSLDGIPVLNLHKDIADIKKGTIYAGDFDMALYGIPYGMTYAISEEATLTTIEGDDGKPLNLFEREMAALRVTMDVAFLILKDEAFASIKAPSV